MASHEPITIDRLRRAILAGGLPGALAALAVSRALTGSGTEALGIATTALFGIWGALCGTAASYSAGRLLPGVLAGAVLGALAPLIVLEAGASDLLAFSYTVAVSPAVGLALTVIATSRKPSVQRDASDSAIGTRLNAFVDNRRLRRATRIALSPTAVDQDVWQAIYLLGQLPATDESLAALRALALGRDRGRQQVAVDALNYQKDPRAAFVLLEAWPAAPDWLISDRIAGILAMRASDLRDREAEAVNLLRTAALDSLKFKGFEAALARPLKVLEGMGGPAALRAIDDVKAAAHRARVAAVPELRREALTSKSYNSIESAIEALKAIDAPEAREALADFHRAPSRAVSRGYEVVVDEHESSGAEIKEWRFVDRSTSELGQTPSEQERAGQAAASRAWRATQVASDPFRHGDRSDIAAALQRVSAAPDSERTLINALFSILAGEKSEQRELVRSALDGADLGSLVSYVTDDVLDRGVDATALLLKRLGATVSKPKLKKAYLSALRAQVVREWSLGQTSKRAPELVSLDPRGAWPLLLDALKQGGGDAQAPIALLQHFGARGAAMAARLLTSNSWQVRRESIRVLGKIDDPSALVALRSHRPQEANYELQQEIDEALAKIRP